MRVTWRTVGSICERVAAEALSQRDLFAGLKRIGIDDFSYRKGHRYLTVVVDHDTGQLVWAAAGRDRKTGAEVPESARRRTLRAARAGLLRYGGVDRDSGQ